MSTFTDPAAPSSGDRIEWGALLGSLLLFDVKGFEAGVTVPYEPYTKDAVRADVTVIDGNGEGADDALVFATVLVSQLKNSVGQKVLGRFGQGKPGKAGNRPPWILEDASPEDKALAEKWVANQQPATASPAPPF